MISKNPAESQASPVPAAPGTKAGAVEAPPLMSPQSPIETAATGTGTGTGGNQGSTDNRPPGVGDGDPLLELLG